MVAVGRLLGATAAGLLLLTLYLAARPLMHWSDRPDQRILYKQASGHRLSMDVFRASGRGNAGPPAALLLFHGGAWERGSSAQFHPQCRHFSRHGLTCFSAEYRTRTRHATTPSDALQDARDAMRYLRRHALQMGIDPRRIAAGGGSAGGQLAAALGVGVALPDPSMDASAPTRPDALLLYNPMLDLGPGRPDHERVGMHWRQLSPRHHVGPGAPPILILSGTADPEVSVETVHDFCHAVTQASGLCEVVLFEGAGHGFFNRRTAEGRYYDRANAAAVKFLRRIDFLPQE